MWNKKINKIKLAVLWINLIHHIFGNLFKKNCRINVGQFISEQTVTNDRSGRVNEPNDPKDDAGDLRKLDMQSSTKNHICKERTSNYESRRFSCNAGARDLINDTERQKTATIHSAF